ncbi:hypothetical protein [Methylobacterium radiodurans]|nr:hypothetical protein [Methylobacterium radiodurans]
MIQALLAGQKTQTRRVIVPPPPFDIGDDITVPLATGEIRPRWAAGDRLWVKETWRATEEWDARPPRAIQPGYTRYEADPCTAHSYGKLRPSIFMPRWASRLTLVVSEVRAQRLLDINEEDAEAEGICNFAEQHDRPGSWNGLSMVERLALVRTIYGSPRQAFRHLWEMLHGVDAWNANPWVAAISFTVLQANIDALPADALDIAGTA